MSTEKRNYTRREFLGLGILTLASPMLVGSVPTEQRGFRQTYGPDGTTHIVESTGTTDEQFEEAFGEQFAGAEVTGDIYEYQNPISGEKSYIPTEGVSTQDLDKLFPEGIGIQVQD